MRHVALFHSVYGLLPSVHAAADELAAAGHDLLVPDLYAGQVAHSLDEGFALAEQIGWTTIMRRARHAVRGLPADTVLAGLSMGAGVAGSLLADRREAAGLLLLHGTGGDAATVRTGLPIQLHIAETDELFPPQHVSAWRTTVAAAGATVQVYTYPGVGHFFTDPDAGDHDPAATARTWQRAQEFLDNL